MCKLTQNKYENKRGIELVRYHFEDKYTKKIKNLADKISMLIPELQYIDKGDFDVVIAVEPAPRSRSTGDTTIAEMNYVTHWLKHWVEHIKGSEIPKFIMIVYPVFFGLPKKRQVKVLIHELFHISPKKRGCRPHTGFGDETIHKFYSSQLRKLSKHKLV